MKEEDYDKLVIEFNLKVAHIWAYSLFSVALIGFTVLMAGLPDWAFIVFMLVLAFYFLIINSYIQAARNLLKEYEPKSKK